MNFDWKWPQLNRLGETKPGILVLALGLAIGFACGQVIHSDAQSNKVMNNQTRQESIPVKIHSTRAPADMESELDEINRWRAAVENLSFAPTLFDPWWRVHESAWPFRDFEPISSNGTTGWAWPGGMANYSPRVESSESGNEIKISAEVPGVDYKNLDVKVKDNSVTIKGEKTTETTQQTASKKLQCIASGSFARTIVLPYRIESDKAQATLRNGILTISAPKSQAAQSEEKKLTIKPENS